MNWLPDTPSRLIYACMLMFIAADVNVSNLNECQRLSINVAALIGITVSS